MSYLVGLGVVAVSAILGAATWGTIRALAGLPLRRVALEVVFVGYLIAVVAVVVVPFGRVTGLEPAYSTPPINLVPLASVIGLVRDLPRQVVRQLGGNVVMFVPLGLLAPVLFARLRRPLTLAATALAVSFGIEVVQLGLRLMSLSPRSFDVDDVLLNIVGALVGYGLWWVTARVVGSRGGRVGAGGSENDGMRSV